MHVTKAVARFDSTAFQLMPRDRHNEPPSRAAAR
jgi:hypothetical protein